MSNPFAVVKQFEADLCEYTGARFAVTTTSCTMSTLIACEYLNVDRVTIPKRTYISVPQSIMRAGGFVQFEDIEWSGIHQLKPYPIFDSARRFTRNMYMPGTFMCLSFHITKILQLSGGGGAILHDDPVADPILRRMRFNGRAEGVHPKDDDFQVFGYNCYMYPDDAAEGIRRLSILPKVNPDLPVSDYSDLSLAAFCLPERQYNRRAGAPK